MYVMNIEQLSIKIKTLNKLRKSDNNFQLED